MASRSAGLVQGATDAAAGIYLVIGLIPASLGLVGPTLQPALTDSESFLPRLAQAELGPIMAALFSGALISTILSTVDNSLLAIGSLGSHNLILRAHPRASERQRSNSARLGVVLAGVVTLVVSIVVQRWGTHRGDHPCPFTLSLLASASTYLCVAWLERARR